MTHQCEACDLPIEGDDAFDRHWDEDHEYHADCCPTCALDRW